MAAIILLITGCYGTKQATWQLDKAHAKFPALTAAKMQTWYPCITSDSSWAIDTIKAMDSSIYFKSLADSLFLVKAKIKDSLAIRYKDSCRSIVDNFNKGFNLGYSVGEYSGKQNCVPDTIRIKTKITKKDGTEAAALQIENDALQRRITLKNVWLKILGITAAISWAFLIFLAIWKYKSDKNNSR